MPILSDFSVVTEADFISRSSTETKSYTFNTGGRHDTRAVIDLALLGGARTDDPSLRVRLRLNGTVLTTIMTNRWSDHSTIVHDRINVVVEPSILRSGNNTLIVEPLWETPNDYLFVGPIVCHFHQRD